jgi:hypothetical protein
MESGRPRGRNQHQSDIVAHKPRGRHADCCHQQAQAGHVGFRQSNQAAGSQGRHKPGDLPERFEPTHSHGAGVQLVPQEILEDPAIN